MVLKDIPRDARPREKLLAHGPAALADAELIALLLRTGLKGTSVLQLAQQLLDHFEGLSGLLQALPEDTQKSLAVSVPFPKLLGRPEQFAALARHIIENTYINGEVIRLDGALRMAPR